MDTDSPKDAKIYRFIQLHSFRREVDLIPVPKRGYANPASRYPYRRRSGASRKSQGNSQLDQAFHLSRLPEEFRFHKSLAVAKR